MGEKTALEIQEKCLERMKKGGLTPDERMACFEEFESTLPGRSSVSAFYDAWGKDYDVDMKVAKYENPVDVANKMNELYADKKDIRILDVGAGTGEGGKKLAELGFTNIDATDGSKGMLAEAEKLGIYKNIYHELLEEGKPMTSISEGIYDAITSSGSFYPFHLKGGNVKCFVNLVKKGGKLVISACPHNDEKLAMKPSLNELESEGAIKIIEEIYVPKWYQSDDGTVYVLEKL